MRNASGLKIARLTLLPRRITLSLASVKPLEKARNPAPKKLLEQAGDAIRLKHYSLRTDLRELCSLDQALHLELATDTEQSDVENPKNLGWL